MLFSGEGKRRGEVQVVWRGGICWGGLISSRLRICIANASVGLCVALLAMVLLGDLFFFSLRPQIIHVCRVSLSSFFPLTFFPVWMSLPDFGSEFVHSATCLQASYIGLTDGHVLIGH